MVALKRDIAVLAVMACMPLVAQAESGMEPFGAREIDLRPANMAPAPVSVFTVGQPESRWPQLRLTLTPEKRTSMQLAKWRPEIRMSSMEAAKAIRGLGLPVRSCETVLRPGSKLGGEIAGGGVRVMVSARFNCGY
ncbi:hypothetical protein [Chitinimonas sp. BJYL2]|uniref:hypothetical protein n=1 Tax=Chitinimonas sp. BJYL2 TaxID=2976696 RepID=UPI0022B4968F|nr:hypothetical protein [Chitinimonas sp. BJYL2]